METDYEYLGAELDLFARAKNWKKYWSQKIRPFVRGAVLDVGAGLGASSEYLFDARLRRWLALEPDRDLVERMKERRRRGHLDPRLEIQQGTLNELEADEPFETILYIDVLEHIENDGAEVRAAGRRLRRGGHLIVLAPAHPWLYSEFDAAIGHFRRYTRSMLGGLTPSFLRSRTSFYLDAVGMLASTANRVLLRVPEPTRDQIRVWDSIMVRLSRSLVDAFLGYRLGRSIVQVWKKV